MLLGVTKNQFNLSIKFVAMRERRINLYRLISAMQGASSKKKTNVVRLIAIEDSTIYRRQSNIFFI